MKSTLKKNWERIVLCLCMANFACIGIAQTNKKLDDQVINTMKTATRFMMDKVSYNGGFVWNYLPDMSRSWGEMEPRGQWYGFSRRELLLSVICCLTLIMLQEMSIIMKLRKKWLTP